MYACFDLLFRKLFISILLGGSPIKSNDNLLLVLASQTDGKVTLTIALSEKLSQAKGLHAGNMVRELAQEIKGGGGGQAFFATAGGKDASGIPTVLQKAEDYL